MRILGIDPGTGRTGYGIIETDNQQLTLVDYGCLTTPAGVPMDQRLVKIFNSLQVILDQYDPQMVAVEKLFFARNVTTGMSVGEARGVIILAIALKGKMVVEYTPLQIKQAITGYGRAEKGQMQRMVQKILKLEKTPRPDDAADALALAIACSTISNYQLNGIKIKNNI